MNYGSLFVKLPDGRELEFPVNKPQILIGRTPDNDLVIAHPTISRRHVRMFFEPDQVIIEDLGSTNGTYVEDQQLDPLQPQSITAQGEIYLGEVKIQHRIPSYYLDDSPKTVDQANIPTIDLDKVSKPGKSIAHSISGLLEPIAPGSTKNAIITIHNTSSSEEELLVRISGLPVSWFRLDKERINLPAYDKIEIILSLHPPRLPEATAGNYHFKVTIYSDLHGKDSESKATLELLPFHNLDLKLEPEVATGYFILVADNQSNVSLDYRFHGADDQQDLLFEFQQSSLRLEAGQTAHIPLRVTSATRRFFSREEHRSFYIIGNRITGTSPKTEARGSLILKPKIPIWAVPLSITILLGILLIAVIIFPRVCPYLPINLAFCPQVPPTIRVLSAYPSEIELGDLVSIDWIVDYADTVELIAPSMSLYVQVPGRGSQEFLLSQSTVFTIRAKNASTTIEDSILIKVSSAIPGIQDFSSNPNAVVLGQTKDFVLSWSVLDASMVIIEGASSEVLPPEGEITIPVPKHDMTFTLLAQNEFGTISRDLTVYVISPGCYVSSSASDEMPSLYAGPSLSHPLVTNLQSGMMVEPSGRTATSDWLFVNAADQEGWLPAEIVSCIVGTHIFPIHPIEKLPTPPSE
jgi:hypothetical protein